MNQTTTSISLLLPLILTAASCGMIVASCGMAEEPPPIIIHTNDSGEDTTSAGGDTTSPDGSWECESNEECDKGDPCTVYTCTDKTCASTFDPAVACDDDNPCTEDSCLEGDEINLCQNVVINECCTTDEQCDDSIVCTNDSCVNNVCVFEEKMCDDNDGCTDDECDADTGECHHTPVDCDDGTTCTVEKCIDDECEYSYTPDECLLDLGCFSPGEKKPGTEGVGCLECNPAISNKEWTPVDCDDDNPCTDDGCNPETGGCTHAVIMNCCESDTDCDDGNACTTDSCADKLCKTVPLVEDCCTTDIACDDEDACTGTETCVENACVTGTSLACDDGNLCNGIETCDSLAGCQPGEPVEGCCTSDDDCIEESNLCVASSLCVEGTCQSEQLDCDDGDLCTIDTCEPATGCTNTSSSSCDDGNPCTDDVCTPLTGACEYMPVEGTCCESNTDCNDDNDCTNDSCELASHTCVFLTNSTKCDDGNACTTDDVCGDGTCLSGTPTLCDDGNPCTVNACEPTMGCTTQPVEGTCCETNADCASGDSCKGTWTCKIESGLCVAGDPVVCEDDDNPCTLDTCADGGCQNLPILCDDGKVCTDDSCDPVTGCTYMPNIAPCNDDDTCTTGDVCSDGACSGTTTDCDDDDPCTTDSCEEDGTCEHTFAGCCESDDECDDGNPCNGIETCGENNVCSDGTALDCDDGKACTKDSCEPGTGMCSNTSIDGCCTSDTTCADDNPCTDDSCDLDEGCQHTFNTSSCDDGNACTDNDSCGDGTCSGTILTCDDGNECTDDSCDPATGCSFTDNIAPCDDGFKCTTEDVCAGGVCFGTSLTCDDGNACTEDSCNPETGVCSNMPIDGCCESDDDCNKVFSFCLEGSCVECLGDTDCDDSDGCTLDACFGNLCQHLELDDCCKADDDCDDGDACNGIETCGGDNVCSEGTPPDCGDGNSCTTDVCEPDTGCGPSAPVADWTPCEEDGNCSLGTCMPSECVAVKFDGKDDFMSITEPTNDFSFVLPFTIETWVKWEGTSGPEWQYLIYAGNVPGNKMMILSANRKEGNLHFRLIGVKSFDLVHPLTKGVWTHVAVTVTATQAHLFVNGNPVAANNMPVAGWSAPTPTTVNIGGRADVPKDHAFQGTIKGVKLSSGALYTENFAPATILVYDAASTMALWTMGEEEGLTAFSKPTGLDATISGASWVIDGPDPACAP